MYQKILLNFQNLAKVKISPPVAVEKMVELALLDENNGWSPNSKLTKQEVKELFLETLNEKNRKILSQYFSVCIDENKNLTCIPSLIEHYKPDLLQLPSFLFSLATKVNWEEEKECFHSISVQLSKFFSLTWHFDGEGDKKEKELGEEKKALYMKRKWQMEHLILSEFKKGFCVPKEFTLDKTVIQIASLEKLYKVFERC